MTAEQRTKLQTRLEDALELECADFGCEGTGSFGCETSCALDDRIKKLRAQLRSLDVYGA